MVSPFTATATVMFAASAEASYTFLAIGDWGGGTITSYDGQFNPNVTVHAVGG